MSKKTDTMKNAIRNHPSIAARAMPTFDNEDYHNSELNNEQNNEHSNIQSTTQHGNQSNNTDAETSDIVAFVHRISRAGGKQTVDETHIRRTYLIKRPLAERLEIESRKYKRGWPTELINGLLEEYFKELDRSHEHD